MIELVNKYREMPGGNNTTKASMHDNNESGTILFGWANNSSGEVCNLVNSSPLIASLLENVPDVLGIVTPDGIIKYKSPNITKWFGWDPNELVGTDAWETVYPEDLPRIQKEFFELLKSDGTPKSVEYRYKCKDGSYKWIELTAINRINDPFIGGILLNYHDIMHFKATEKALQDSIQTAIEIIGSIPSGLFVYQFIAPDKLILLSGNTEAEKITGKKINDIMGMEFNEIWPNAFDSGLTEKYLNVIHTDKLLEIEECAYKDEKLDGVFRIKVFKMPGNKLGVAFEDITQRYKAEIELLDQIKFFEQVFSQSSISTQILDKDGWCLRINPKLTELFGVQPEDIEGGKYNIFQDEGIKQGGIIPYLEKVFHEGLTAEWEVYFDIGIAADSQNIKVNEKKKVWFHNWAFPIFNSKGILTNVVIQHTDITKRKDAEKALKESESKFKTVADYAYNWNYLEDIKGNIIYMSPSCFRITGYTRQEFVANPSLLNSIIHDDDKAEYQKHLDYGHSDYEIGEMCEQEFKIVKKDGTIAYVSHICMSIIDENQNCCGRRISNRDITDKKLHEKALTESKNQLKLIFDNTPAVMFLLNEQTEILMINKPGIELSGKSDDVILGMQGGNALNCLHSFDTPMGCGYSSDCRNCIIRNTVLDTLKSNTNHYKIEATLKTLYKGKINEYTVLLSTSIASLSPEKTVLVSIDNITDRKKLENDLLSAKNKAEESEKLKTAFLQNMSHEIRTPLNGILGFTGLLEDNNISSVDRLEYIDVIKKSGQRLLEIVNNTLDISRIETGQMELRYTSVPLKMIMDNLFESNTGLATQKGLKLECHINNKYRNFSVYSDDRRLFQIVDNLLKNAIKFTFSGTVEYGFRIDGNFVEIFVGDTGIGIPKDFHKKIFDRFVQVDNSISRGYEGAGLGLAICKGLVELMGGTINLRSHIGKGTIFYVRLPLVSPPDTGISGQPAKDNTNEGKHTVLVAEDDIVSFDFLNICLRRLGYYVLHAANGLEAVEMSKSNQNIDVILMDLKMPHLNGIEASEIIKSDFPEIKIIAQTSYSDDNKNGMKSNKFFDGYITKPINIKELSEKLSYILEQK